MEPINNSQINAPVTSPTKSKLTRLKIPGIVLLVLILMAGSFYLGTKRNNQTTPNNSAANTTENTESNANVSTESSEFNVTKDGLVADFAPLQTYASNSSITYNVFFPKLFNFDLKSDRLQMSFINGGINEVSVVDTGNSQNSECTEKDDGVNCTLVWDLSKFQLVDGETLVKFKVLDNTTHEKGRIFVGPVYMLGQSSIFITGTQETASSAVRIKLGESGSKSGFTFKLSKTHIEDAEYVTGSKYHAGTTDLDTRSFLVADFTIENGTKNDTSYSGEWSFLLTTNSGKIYTGQPVKKSGSSSWADVGYAAGSTATGQQAFAIDADNEQATELTFKSPLWFNPADSIIVEL